MTLFDDEPVKLKAQYLVGSDLSILSVDELSQTIDLLRAEIERLTEERDRKFSGIQAAEALFKS